jgi:hypothetical protein
MLNMVIAMGAMTVANNVVNDAPLARHHTTFAIERYQRALMILRKSLAMSPSIRTSKRFLVPLVFPVSICPTSYIADLLTNVLPALVSYWMIMYLEIVVDMEGKSFLNLRPSSSPSRTVLGVIQNARSFICGRLREQLNEGKHLRNFLSPAPHIIEDDLMAASYWFLVCHVSPRDAEPDFQIVGTLIICYKN